MCGARSRNKQGRCSVPACCRRVVLSDGASSLLCNRPVAGARPPPWVLHVVSSAHTHQQVLLRVECDKAKAAGAVSHLVQHNCCCLGVEGPESCSSSFVLSMHALQLRAVLPGAAGHEAPTVQLAAAVLDHAVQ